MKVMPILCEVAEANPSLGYRRVWAKAKNKGIIGGGLLSIWR
jgi:hypothetical protein